MSFVLSVVSLNATEDIPIVDSWKEYEGGAQTKGKRRVIGALRVEEVIQRSGGGHAGFLAGLSRYFGYVVEGAAYYVCTDTGERFKETAGDLAGKPYSNSSEFFPWEEDHWQRVRLVIPSKYRPAFSTLIENLGRISPDGKVLILCEWNGDVSDPIDGSAPENLLTNTVSGIEGFWGLHDAGGIMMTSITIIEM